MRLKNTAKNDVTMPMMEQEETAEVPQGKQKIEATIANNLVEKEQKSQSASSLKISRSSPLPEKQVKAMHPETTIFEQNDKVRDKTIPSSSESPIPPPVIKIPLKNSKSLLKRTRQTARHQNIRKSKKTERKPAVPPEQSSKTSHQQPAQKSKRARKVVREKTSTDKSKQAKASKKSTREDAITKIDKPSEENSTHDAQGHEKFDINKESTAANNHNRRAKKRQQTRNKPLHNRDELNSVAPIPPVQELETPPRNMKKPSTMRKTTKATSKKTTPSKIEKIAAKISLPQSSPKTISTVQKGNKALSGTESPDTKKLDIKKSEKRKTNRTNISHKKTATSIENAFTVTQEDGKEVTQQKRNKQAKAKERLTAKMRPKPNQPSANANSKHPVESTEDRDAESNNVKVQKGLAGEQKNGKKRGRPPRDETIQRAAKKQRTTKNRTVRKRALSKEGYILQPVLASFIEQQKTFFAVHVNTDQNALRRSLRQLDQPNYFRY